MVNTSSSSVTVRRINQHIGAEILNVDLSQPLSDPDYDRK